MATPIKATPMLSGKSSRKFNETLRAEQNSKVSDREWQRMQDIVRRVLSKKVK